MFMMKADVGQWDPLHILILILNELRGEDTSVLLGDELLGTISKKFMFIKPIY